MLFIIYEAYSVRDSEDMYAYEQKVVKGIINLPSEDDAREYCEKYSNRIVTGMTCMNDPLYEGVLEYEIPEKLRHDRSPLAISEDQAKEFWRDLIEVFYKGKHPKGNTGILYISGVADWLDITEEKAKEICNAWIEYDITERQGGGIVI